MSNWGLPHQNAPKKVPNIMRNYPDCLERAHAAGTTYPSEHTTLGDQTWGERCPRRRRVGL